MPWAIVIAGGRGGGGGIEIMWFCGCDAESV